ncbi:MAG TPA: phosphoadenosine phosphosulfate reductase family protein [Rectinema sp.]|nr:phosphoadenosine phosphosulfate reductase family protein [Rectinema sp.]
MKERHLLALSGGKDSAALAVYMREKYPHLPMEYVFIDSGHELPETYEYLEKIRAILNIDIIQIRPPQNFDYWLSYFGGVLPSPSNRWCTRLLKLKPFNDWIQKTSKNYRIFNYVGLRADEDRQGYRSNTDEFVQVHPFVTDGLVLDDIKQILIDEGIGFPSYYSWRQRSGCYFCFYQRDDEWRGLREHHPDLFTKACAYEEGHKDGRSYTWRDSGLLRDLTDSVSLTSRNKTLFVKPYLKETIGKITSPISSLETLLRRNKT